MPKEREILNKSGDAGYLYKRALEWLKSTHEETGQEAAKFMVILGLTLGSTYLGFQENSVCLKGIAAVGYCALFVKGAGLTKNDPERPRASRFKGD